MQRQVTVILLLCVLWGGISWYWYACSIKGLCSDDTSEFVVTMTKHKTASLNGHAAPVAHNLCAPYITQPLAMGRVNDAQQVKRLKRFLREVEGFSTGPASEVFDQATKDAVNRFQYRYEEDILVPLNINEPTGNVYGATMQKINDRYCSVTSN